MKRMFWIAFVGLLIINPAVFAAGEKGPHKGQMLLQGTHRFELVVGASDFSIYVMDMKRQPLPLKGVTGSATIHWNDDKNSKDVPLVAEKDHLVGKMDLKKLGKAEVHAKIVVDGKEVTVGPFEYPPD